MFMNIILKEINGPKSKVKNSVRNPELEDSATVLLKIKIIYSFMEGKQNTIID